MKRFTGVAAAAAMLGGLLLTGCGETEEDCDTILIAYELVAAPDGRGGGGGGGGSRGGGSGGGSKGAPNLTKPSKPDTKKPGTRPGKSGSNPGKAKPKHFDATDCDDR